MYGGKGGSSGTVVDETWNYISSGAVFVVPTTNVGTAAAQISVAFTITTGGTLGSLSYLNILTQGTAGLDFTLGTNSTCTGTVVANTTCVVNVVFKPMAPGLRMGAVNLTNSSGNIIATTYISGIGTGPQVVFNPGSSSSFDLGYYTPHNLTVDASGNLYVLNNNGGSISESSPLCTQQACAEVLGGGTLIFPGGMAVDGAGNVYVSSTNLGTIQKMSPGCTASGCVSTLINNLTNSLNDPEGLAVDGFGNLYVVDRGNNMIKEVPAGCASSNCMITVMSTGLSNPIRIAVDASGNLYVTNTGYGLVDEIPAGCTSSDCMIALGGGGFTSNGGITVDGGGNVYITNDLTDSVTFIPSGCLSSDCVTTLLSGGDLDEPVDVALDDSGNLYVANELTYTVTKISRAAPPSLSFGTVADGSSSTPQTVTFANIGNAPLTFPIPGTGINPSLATNFSISSSTCPRVTAHSSSLGTLAVGSSCTVPIIFAPAGGTSGSVNGSLIFTDNNLNATSATQTVSLSGMATDTATQLGFGTALTSPISEGDNPGVVTVNMEDITGATVTGASGIIRLTMTYPDTSVRIFNAQTISGVATFDLSSIALTAAGTYTYGASLAGVTSASATENLVANTITMITSDQNPAPINTPVTFTAMVSTISAQPATGTVTFSAPGQTSQIIALINGSASAIFSFATAASVSVTASFNGNMYYVTSNQSAAQVIQKPFSYLVTTLADDAAGVGANCIDDATDTTGGNNNCSLRDAIAASNTVGASGVSLGATINFLSSLASASSPGTINIATGGAIMISTSMNLNGPGANVLTVEGYATPHSGGDHQIFVVNGGTNSIISGLTFANGSGSSAGINVGEAIKHASGTLTVNNCIFSNNQSSGGNGGAIYAVSTLIVNNSTFSGNSVNLGSGGAIYTSSPLTVNNSTFSDNLANGNAGGAIDALSTLIVNNSTFSGNSANGGSGGAINGVSTLTVNSSTFSGNSTDANSYGSAIYSSSTLTVSDSIFSGNLTSDGTIFVNAASTINKGIFHGNTSGTCPSGCTFTNVIITDPMLSAARRQLG